MNVKVIENEKGKLKLELDDLTFVNMLNEAVWQKNPKLSAYTKYHPYLQDPVIAAGEQILKDIDTLRKQVSK